MPRGTTGFDEMLPVCLELVGDSPDLSIFYWLESWFIALNCYVTRSMVLPMQMSLTDIFQRSVCRAGIMLAMEQQG